MATPEVLKQSIGRPLGKIPSGIFIISARHQGRGDAQLASWVQQAAFDPPCVSIALAKGRPIVPLIQASGKLVISILAETGLALMKRYARGTKAEAGEDPFAGVRTVNSPAGIPAMADALAYLECEVLQWCAFEADHDLVIAKIVAGELLKDTKPFVHTRGNGFHY